MSLKTLLPILAASLGLAGAAYAGPEPVNPGVAATLTSTVTLDPNFSVSGDYNAGVPVFVYVVLPDDPSGGSITFQLRSNTLSDRPGFELQQVD